MRTRTISSWRKALLATAAAASLAGGTRAQDAAPAGDTPPAPPGERGQMQAPAASGEAQSYTIVKGDTLWDLSQKFLNNPWYWPKIWSLNPSIENPHWIYPGNNLKIQAGAGGAPAQVDPQAAAAPPGQAGPGGQPAPEGQPPAAAEEAANDDPLAPSTPAGPDLTLTSSAAEKAAANQSVTAAGRLSYKAPGVLLVRASGLVTEDEMKNAGNLDASFEEKQMLAQYDTAYVRFKQDGLARVGDKLLIFRPAGDIIHPKTHLKIGVKTKTVGEVKVVAVTGPVVTVQVGRTWEEIERGDLVRPWSDQLRRLAPKPNTRSVDGLIVSAVSDTLTTLGETHEVFIDKGKSDGVEDGNTFYVVRNGDGLTLKGGGVTTSSETAGEAGEKANKLQQPDENVAMLMVIDARDNLSVAVVIRSVREIEAGERVEMRPGGSGGDTGR